MTSTPSGPEIGSQPRSGHERAVAGTLVSEVCAGTTILEAFHTSPMVFHASLATPGGWNQSVRFCRDETAFDRATRHRSVGAALRHRARPATGPVPPAAAASGPPTRRRKT
jgi:hypothetical protein